VSPNAAGRGGLPKESTVGRNFLPWTDAGLLTWAGHLSQKVSDDPAAYGLSADAAADLAAKQAAYAAAYAAAVNPATRGLSTVFAKSTAKSELSAYCRVVARQIQGTSTVTDQQRVNLGLPVRSRSATPIPRPADAPTVVLGPAVGRTLRVRLFDAANPTRRGRPVAVDGAAVFTHVGPTSPPELSDWTRGPMTTKTTLDLTFGPDVVPGAVVWVTAYWFNPRKQNGPTSRAVSAHLPGGAVSLRAA
jgi:hypothetical protein